MISQPVGCPKSIYGLSKDTRTSYLRPPMRRMISRTIRNGCGSCSGSVVWRSWNVNKIGLKQWQRRSSHWLLSEMIWRLESAQVVSCCVYEVPNNRDNEWPNLFGHLLLPHSSIFFQSIIVIKFVTKTFQKLANLVTLPLYHHHGYLRDLQLIVDLDGVQILVLLHFT